MVVPNDPIMLMSYLNTQLRDNFSSLQELCRAMDLEEKSIKEKLSAVGYIYHSEQNQFLSC